MYWIHRSMLGVHARKIDESHLPKKSRPRCLHKLVTHCAGGPVCNIIYLYHCVVCGWLLIFEYNELFRVI